MKVVLATVSVSMALSAVHFSPALAQARGGVASSSGASASGGAGSAAAGRAAIAPAAPVSSSAATVGAPGGTVTGTAVGTPGTGTPVGPVNPGGITATPPQVAGRTFERTTIGGAPTDAIVDPAAPQPTFRFPPSSTLQEPIRTNFGIGQFPPVTLGGNAPVTVGNTVVGANSQGGANIRPVEPVAINLPPGARMTTNSSGVREIGFPPVTVPVTTNAVGSSPGVQSSTVRVAPVTPQPNAPIQAPITAPR